MTLPRPSDAQLDGLACIVCGDFDGDMEPVGMGPRGQIFAHPECFGDAPDTLDRHRLTLVPDE